MRDHFGSEGAEPQSDNAVANGNGCDFGTSAGDVSAQFPSQVSLFNEAERAEHVPEVESCSFDRDTNLLWLKGAWGKRF